jgi:hypothetical protein
MAVALTVLLGAAAMAVDVGYLRYMQRTQQSAADSAAIAGANELAYPAANDVVTAARADAAANGFTHNGTTTNVIVNWPPAAGPLNGNASAVEVIVSAQHATFFERLFGMPSATVQARAVAMLGTGNGNGACIYALNNDIDMNATTIRAPSCGIISNGIINFNSDNITAASIGAVGQINSNASTFPEASPAHSLPAIDPCPTIDACRNLTSMPPAQTPCTYSNVSKNAWTGTMYPGVYCQSTNLNASNVTFAPGLYVWVNGLNVNATTMTGSGVTFYIANSSMNVNAAGMNLTAPTTGPDAGILVYQPSSNQSSANLNASGSSDVEGTIYLPTGTLTTNATFNTWMLVIAGIIHMNSANVTVPGNNTYVGAPRRGILAE